MIECKYGHFSQDGKEYIITNPFTPRPWINSISNGDYSMVVSQMGGGFSFRVNAEQNRLTRHLQDMIKDNWGKYYYVRDLQSGNYWSTTLMPIKAGCDNYVVRHGVGYTIFERDSYGIKTEQKVFVSANRPMEYAVITLTNNRDTTAHLDLTNYFEWAPGIAFDTHREYHKLFSTLSFDEKLNSILISKCLWGFPDAKGRHNNDDWPYTAFCGCNLPASSYDCDKEKFLGMYNDERNPSAMEKELLSNSDGRYGDPVASIRTKEIVLAPGQSKQVVYVIGVARKEQESYQDMIALCNEIDAQKQFQGVEAMWQKLIFSQEWVETPDKAFDVMTNIWSKYQALSGRMWAKAGYYQISGGIGFRDQLQDSLVMLENDPSYTKKQILLHAEHQFQMGDVQHWWLQIGTCGPRTKCSDDLLWMAFATVRYVWETGDYTIFDEVVPFVDGGEPATLKEHLRRSIELCFERFSPRGIPLMGDHDWNDGLSAVGNGMIGESFWVAEFLYSIITDYAPILQRLGDDSYATLLNKRAEQLKKDFNEHGWDGEWFLQATNDDGDKLGSHTCQEGKIFLNPQIWAVMSDITDANRKQQAMDAVTKYLLKDYGTVLLSPEYQTPRENIGYITRYAPGLRENGGVYTHAATWSVWAYALLGNNKLAYEAYKRICPPNRSGDIDSYVSEPYVTCGNSDGPISPYYGKGGWSWYTGSAQWLHGVAIWWILGVRPTVDGLKVAPCIPDEWEGFKYKRTYRGCTYNFEVINKKSGKKSITFDGKVLSGDLLPIEKGEHTVVVTL